MFTHYPAVEKNASGKPCACRGFKVGVVERGPLLGREQEWNISEAELEEMVEANVLSKEASFVGGLGWEAGVRGWRRAWERHSICLCWLSRVWRQCAWEWGQFLCCFKNYFQFLAQLVRGFTLSDLLDRSWSNVSSLPPFGTGLHICRA